MEGFRRKLCLLWIAMGIAGIAMGAVKELPLPDVPAELKAPGERAAYILRHFWDGMDWRDTTLTHDIAFMEQNAVNFFSLFPHADSVAVSDAADKVVTRCASDSLSVSILSDLAGSYLYERESPVWNEAGYEIMGTLLLQSGALPAAERLRVEARLEGLAKNRPGSMATDFEFIARNGSRHTLHESLEGSRKGILVLYDPDCGLCNDLERQLAENPMVNDAIASGELKVVFVTPFEIDGDVWERHAAGLPESWVVGYSPEGGIDAGELYDLGYIPAVYLLSPSPIIHTRNANSARILSFLVLP